MKQLLSLLFALVSFTFSFSQSSNEGPGGPILVVYSSSNPFSQYATEILRAEGLNEFSALDITAVSAGVLNNYDVVILGEMTLTSTQVTMLTNWTNAGGTLIAFRPAAGLAPLMGITSAGGTLNDKYLLVNTASGPGVGIVNTTIQFHGSADRYTLNGATSIATLYSDATTATTYPAITTRTVGSNGKAIAFTYDLAKSIIYTRQGNPAWAGQERDGIAGIRSNDMFYGNKSGDVQPDWIDLNKVAIPQADEQQRLLVNIIIKNNLQRKPLPRFWFLPKGLKAAIVMTGDDHANGGTVGRFNQYKELGPNTPQAVADWTAIRSTSYIYPGTLTNAEAMAFEADGFEIALHPFTGCTENWTPASLQTDLTNQLGQLASELPGISSPRTSRTHCVPWSDWSSMAQIEAGLGIRLDVNYYYWPAAWVADRPGMFTGSGMPMRFADINGTIIDCYQVATQMTDESGISYAAFCNALLDKALGPEGYYGVFATNMHTDLPQIPGSDAIVASAIAHNVPVISTRQMLNWLDGRNGSAFGSITMSGNQLNFSINALSAANNLTAMLPSYSDQGQLISITRDGNVIAFTTEIIKGIQYAFFEASSGDYIASYPIDNTPPVISNIVAVPHNDNTATITWTTNEVSPSQVDYGFVANNLNLNATDNNPVTHHSIILTGLEPGRTYYFRVTSKDAVGNAATAPTLTNPPLNFTMLDEPCFADRSMADFNLGIIDANTLIVSEGGGAITLRPVMNEEFSGTSLPAGWLSAVFSVDGSTSVNDGSVTVNGAHIFTNTSFVPGSSIEFIATFTTGDFQNIGFTVNQAFDSDPWVTLGQASTDGNLYARASDGSNISIGPGLLGAPHRYRIQWNENNFQFYVDGNSIPSATISMGIASNMYIQISDAFATDGALSVDWMQVTPFATSGTFTSRVFDAGATKTWGAVTWNSNVPGETNLAIAVRTGNTPIPDATWSAYSVIGMSGNILNSVSRYIQYKADLATTNTRITPVLKDIAINCSDGDELLMITIHPVSQIICAGNKVSFTSAARGIPAPTVQWQVSTDGRVWTNIHGATSSTLSFIPTTTNNNKQYRAVWKNSIGSAYSNPAILTVQKIPAAPVITIVNKCGFSILKASSYKGTLLWSNGETTSSITVNTAATYSVTQTVNGCTSAARSARSVPKPLPATPVISVSGATAFCQGGSAILTSSSSSRNIWNTGSTRQSIVVSTSGSYMVRTTGTNGCSSLNSEPVVITVTPNPVAPTITVVNNCGNSVLTASGYTGTLLWSNGATTASITVVNAATYTVRQTVNGCTSAACSAVSAPKSCGPVDPNKCYTLIARHSGKALDVSGGSIANGAKIIQYQYSGGNNQKWKFTQVETGFYRIVSVNSGKVLDVEGVSTADGANVLQWTWNGGNNQKWSLTQNGSYFVVKAKHSGKAMSVAGSSNSNGAKVEQRGTGSSTNQQWTISEVGCPNSMKTSELIVSQEKEKVIQSELTLTVHPNPGISYFDLTIKSSDNTPVNVRVFDINGKILSGDAKTGANTILRIGADKWTDGIYFAEVIQGDQRKIVKIVKVN